MSKILVFSWFNNNFLTMLRALVVVFATIFLPNICAYGYSDAFVPTKAQWTGLFPRSDSNTVILNNLSTATTSNNWSSWKDKDPNLELFCHKGKRSGGGTAGCSLTSSDSFCVSVNAPMGSTFVFGLSLAGIFKIDWDDGTVYKVYRTNNTNLTFYSHTYLFDNNTNHTICVKGSGTIKVNTNTKNFTWSAANNLQLKLPTPAVIFSEYYNNSNVQITGLSGMLSRLLNHGLKPAYTGSFIGNKHYTGSSVGANIFNNQSNAGSVDYQFAFTFAGSAGSNDTARFSIDLFNGVPYSSAKYLFAGTFAGSKLLPSMPTNSKDYWGPYSGSYSLQEGMFAYTFAGSELYGAIPYQLFNLYTGTIPTNAFKGTFYNCTGLGTDSRSGTTPNNNYYVRPSTFNVSNQIYASGGPMGNIFKGTHLPYLCPAGLGQGTKKNYETDWQTFATTSSVIINGVSSTLTWQHYAVSCSSCPSGTYNNGNYTQCQNCSDGYYSLGGASSCTACSAGKYSNSGHTGCLTCGTGQYSTTGSASCTKCAAGKYTTDHITCQTCASGYISSAPGAESCSACSAGTYSSSDHTSCINCPKGKYQAYQAHSSCNTCATGYISNITGATSCTACGKGTYSSSDHTSCINCPKGKYQANTGKGSCDTCPSGTYSASTGSTACTQCPTAYPNTDSTSVNDAQTKCYATITYMTNGGALSGINTVTANTKYTQKIFYNSKVTATPTKANYVFGGWYKSANFDSNTKVTNTTALTGDMTLYAKWTYKVVYVSNGGNGTSEVTKSDIQSGTSHALLSASSAGIGTKADHEFAGWCVGNGNTNCGWGYRNPGTTICDSGSCNVQFTPDSDGKIRVYAQWKRVCAKGSYYDGSAKTCKTCPANFACLGITHISGVDDNVSAGKDACPTEFPFSDPGSQYLEDCYANIYVYPKNDEYPGDVSYPDYMQYSDHAVMHAKLGGTESCPNVLASCYGQSGCSTTNYCITSRLNAGFPGGLEDVFGKSTGYIMVHNLPTPQRSGYDFDGWYYNNALLPVVDLNNPPTTQSEANQYLLTGDINVYARWSAQENSVSLDKQSGSGGTSVLYTTYDAGVYLQDNPRDSTTELTPTNDNSIDIPTGPQVTVYYYDVDGSLIFSNSSNKSFEGYYNNTGWTTRYIDLNGKITDAGLTVGKSYTTNDTNIVWYAKYSCANVDLLSPQKTGYQFSGWYDSTSYTNKITSLCLNETRKNLYAKWTANTYTIHFDENGGTVNTALDDLLVHYDTAVNDNPAKTLPNANGYFVKTDYHLDGWCTKASCSGSDNKHYNAGITVPNLTTTNGDTVTLYAKWVRDYNSCNAGQYYSGTDGICKPCEETYYCKGVEFDDTDPNDQGNDLCADIPGTDGQFTLSEPESTTESDCYTEYDETKPCSVINPINITNAINIIYANENTTTHCTLHYEDIAPSCEVTPGVCNITSVICATGYTWDSTSNTCVLNTRFCNPGSYYDVDTDDCVPCTQGNYCPGKPCDWESGSTALSAINNGLCSCAEHTGSGYPYSVAQATNIGQCYRPETANCNSADYNPCPNNAQCSYSTLSKSCKRYYDADPDVCVLDNPGACDMTFTCNRGYAKNTAETACEIINYSLHYELNGGDWPAAASIPPSSYNINTIGSVASSIPTPLKATGDFVGWCDDNNSSSCAIVSDLVETLNNLKSRTLYAQWHTKIYKVNLNHESSDDVIYEEYGRRWKDANNYTLDTVNIPIKADSIFTGYWTTQSEGGSKIIPETGCLTCTDNPVSTTTFDDDNTAPSADEGIDGETTLYARFISCTPPSGGNNAGTPTLTIENNKCSWSATCNTGYHAPYQESSTDDATVYAIGGTTGLVLPDCLANEYTVTYYCGESEIISDSVTYNQDYSARSAFTLCSTIGSVPTAEFTCKNSTDNETEVTLPTTATPWSLDYNVVCSTKVTLQQKDCAPGLYLPANTLECAICEPDQDITGKKHYYYCTGGTYYFNPIFTQGRLECVDGTVSPVGARAWEDCGHMLHIGTDVLYLHKNPKPGIPSLTIRFSDGPHYADMSLVPSDSGSAKPMNIETNNLLHVKFYDGSHYTVHDNTVNYAESD